MTSHSVQRQVKTLVKKIKHDDERMNSHVTRLRMTMGQLSARNPIPRGRGLPRLRFPPRGENEKNLPFLSFLAREGGRLKKAVPFPPGAPLSGGYVLGRIPFFVLPLGSRSGKVFVFCMRGAHACCHILTPRQRSALLQVHDTTRATSARGGAARNAEYAGLLIASGILVFLMEKSIEYLRSCF